MRVTMIGMGDAGAAPGSFSDFSRVDSCSFGEGKGEGVLMRLAVLIIPGRANISQPVEIAGHGDLVMLEHE